jgi:hypothetical protein
MEKIAKTRQQMADEYHIHRTTFWRRLKGAGIELTDRKLIFPREQELIYEVFGPPAHLNFLNVQHDETKSNKMQH